MPPEFVHRAGAPVMRRVLSLHPDSIVVAAVKAGGGPELGTEAITEPLEVLCGALRNEARLHAGGIVAARRRLVGLLATRGRVLRLIRRHPEIDSLSVPAPIVITGLPLTGGETLQERLSAERGFTRPEGEDDLLGVHLASMRFELDWHVPAYAEWYDEADLVAGYGWLRRLLQVRQWEGSGTSTRWVLRSPQHLEQLPALLATFPDAVVVQTHGDTAAAVEEMALMIAGLRRRSSAAVNPTQIARYWRWRAERMLERNAAQRAAIDPTRLVDVAHDRVVADAPGVVAGILAQLGVTPDN